MVRDMWKFNLDSLQWTQIGKGKHMTIRANPHGIYNGKWWIVDTSMTPSQVMSFDLTKHAYKMWSISAPTDHSCGSTRPSYDCSECASWMQEDGKMGIWGVDKADVDEGNETKSTMTRATMWVLDVGTGRPVWDKRAIVGESKGEGTSRRLDGQISLLFSEACASYDVTNKKGYVFGGWRDDFNWCNNLQ
jgi:hypothetical protein